MLVIAVVGHGQENFDNHNFSEVFLRSRLRVTLRSIISQSFDEEVLLMHNVMSDIDLSIVKAGFQLRERYPIGFLQIEAVIPCVDRLHLLHEELESIKYHYDIVTYISKMYTPWCISRKNHYMVDNCDILLAVWGGTQGKVADCIQYAENKGKKIIVISP